MREKKDRLRSLAQLAVFEATNDQACPRCKGTQFEIKDPTEPCKPCKGTGRYRIKDSQRSRAIGVSRQSWAQLWDERYKNIKFASICCGADHKCTDVRNILEKEDNPRWDKISHYFMDFESKEEAKKALGFKQVPFYVVLNDEGEIVMMGSKKYIDFDNLPGMVHPTPIKVEKKAESVPSPTNVAAAEEAFAILDLDF